MGDETLEEFLIQALTIFLIRDYDDMDIFFLKLFQRCSYWFVMEPNIEQ